MIPLDYAQISDRGLRRQRNEDYLAVNIPEADSPQATVGNLFLVADGIGSLGMGEVASQLATERILDSYYAANNPTLETSGRIATALKSANQAVFERSADYELAYMGTTVAGLVLTPNNEAIAFNIGDSRVYRIRGGKMELVSRDHATPAIDGSKPKLTAYIGQSSAVPPYTKSMKTKRGDVFLICTDGLWGVLEEKEILRIVRGHNAETAAQMLLEKVHEHGARDNVTFVIVRMGAFTPGRNLLPGVLAVLTLLVIGAGVYFLTQNGDEKATPTPLRDALGNIITETPTHTVTPSVTPVTPTHTPSITPTPDVAATRTANARATINGQTTKIAQATGEALATLYAQATVDEAASLEARQTAQSQATTDAVLAATVFVRRTQTAIVAATSLPATETQAVIIAGTVVVEETRSAGTATAIYIASLPVTPTLTTNPTLTTYTPTPSPTLTLSPTITLTPSMTLTPSITPTPSDTPVPTHTPTPTLSPQDFLEAAQIGVVLNQETVLRETPSTNDSAALLAAQSKVRYTGEQEDDFVQVLVLDGSFEGETGWIEETVLRDSTPIIVYAVTNTTATIRSSNGANFARIGQVQPNTRLLVIGISDRGERWYLVQLPDGDEGWIAPSVVSIEGDVALIPSVTPPTP